MAEFGVGVLVLSGLLVHDYGLLLLQLAIDLLLLL